VVRTGRSSSWSTDSPSDLLSEDDVVGREAGALVLTDTRDVDNVRCSGTGDRLALGGGCEDGILTNVF